MDEQHFLVGTAGHVDHGKTELIRALSGMETDHLKEEKQRGISIELGFAYMTLPSGRQIGIVDVPGHERFVRQMLAGASGIDFVLLVIAADEGIKPQTREHLEILKLLGITRGIVVLNKADLVDEEWLDFIEEEVREELKETSFHEATICRVSAQTGLGIQDLIKKMDEILDLGLCKTSNAPVRMPIDRVFSIQGFGTVVTGTLYSGILKIGQELAIEPGHISTRVRSLQVFKKKVDSAVAGQRVAVNITGIDVAEIERGSVLVMPKVYKVGNVLDLKVMNLISSEKFLIQRQRVRFHIGTSEILGRIHLLDQQELAPGQEGYIQILLEEPVVAESGDHFVLRSYSPAHTIAGGKVLGVAEFKYKRFKEKVLTQMRIKDQGNPLDLLEREIEEPQRSTDLAARMHLSQDELEEFLRHLKEAGRLEIWMDDDNPLYWGKVASEVWMSNLLDLVKTYQESNPLRGGIGREELKKRLGIKWSHRRWQVILEQGGVRGLYRISGSKIQTNERAEIPRKILDRLELLREKWRGYKMMPPDFIIAAEECGILKSEALEYAQYLCDIGEWVPIDTFFYNFRELELAKVQLIELLKEKGEVGVSEVREVWGTSRKYTVPLLEYFDHKKITKRDGDKRRIYA